MYIYTKLCLQLLAPQMNVTCAMGGEFGDMMAPDQVIRVPTITTTYWNFGRQSDRDSDTKNKTLKIHLFMYCMITNRMHTSNNHYLKRLHKVLGHGKQN